MNIDHLQPSRREFIATTAAMAMAGGVAPAFLRKPDRASPDRNGIVVILQLTGGNDALNTVIPAENNLYYKARPSLGVRKGSGLHIGSRTALHPSMPEFKGMYEKGTLAIIQNVGYQNPDRSHFRSLEIWHTAQAGGDPPAGPVARSGWAGRAADALAKETGGVAALHIGSTVQPQSIISEHVIVPSIADLDRASLKFMPRGELQQMVALSAVERAPGPAGFIAREAGQAYAIAGRIAGIARRGTKVNPYPPGTLGRKLETIAQFIGADLPTRIYHVEFDGFDTHANQAQTQALLLKELSGSLYAFYEDLKQKDRAADVVTFIFSEFGRRVRENASGGTDHGAAGCAFLAGPRVVPGLHGGEPDLEHLDAGDVTMQVDYRRIYSTLLRSVLDLDPQTILGRAPGPIPILR